MEDDRTQKTLDALGDLYLTNPGPGAASKTEEKESRDPLDAPGPFQLSPRATTTEPKQSRVRSPRARDRRGFAVAASHDVATETPASRRASAEAVFLGNLPGFGGPWLTQYAHQLARAAGPIAVLHIDDEQVDLELIGAGEHRRELDTLTRAADLPSEEGLLATLDVITADHLPPLGAFLLHLPDPLSDTSRTLAADLDNWTIVCSSDQAAVVSAYRWIKGLLEDEEVGQSPHRIGLMVMGSDEQTAQETSAKLSETAGNFLATDIELIGSLKQMVPVQMKTLGSFEGGEGVWPQLLAWLEDRADGQTVTLPRSQPPRMTAAEMEVAAEEDGIPTAALDELPEDLLPSNEIASAVLEPAATTYIPDDAPPVDGDAPSSVREFVERLKKPKTQEPSSAAPPPPVEPEPAPESVAAPSPSPAAAPQPVAVANTDDNQPSLAELVKDQRVVALRARCPHDNDVQLGVGEDGRLQLLLRHSGEADHLKEALSRLTYVGHWAGLHAEILQLTAPDTSINSQLAPAMHLFTEYGKAAAAMVAYVDPDTHLHLLQRIVVGDQRTWFCTALK